MKHWLFGFAFAVLVVALMFLSFALAIMDECQIRGYNTAAIGTHGIYCINQSKMERIDKPHATGGDL